MGGVAVSCLLPKITFLNILLTGGKGKFVLFARFLFLAVTFFWAVARVDKGSRL
jgi:hypothetical protein